MAMMTAAVYPQFTIILSVNWDKYNPSSADTKALDSPHKRPLGLHTSKTYWKC